MTPAQNVIEKIGEAMKRDGNAIALAGLAAEYSALCRKINGRLAQIESVIEHGDDYQAIELAETRPAVLEEANTLAFNEIGKWIEYCENNQLEVPPKLSFKTVQRLNKIYSKGITPNHRLYKEFRDSVLSKDDQKALAIARKIVRLNPQDLNAAAELRRLENKTFLQQERDLSLAVEASDEDRTIELLERLEQLGNEEKASSSQAVQTGISIRAQAAARSAQSKIDDTIPTLADLVESGQWLKAGEAVSHIETLTQEHHLEISTADKTAITKARDFFNSSREETMRRIEFHNEVKQLETITLEAENLSQARGTINLEEGRAKLLALNRQWQIVEGYTLPVDDELVKRVGRVATFLKSEIDRLLKNKRIKWGSAAFASTVVLAAVAYFVLTFLRAADAEQQLKKGMTERSVIVVEKLIASTRQKYSNAESMPSLLASLQKAETWAKDERSRENHAEQVFNNLNTSLVVNAPPETVYSNWQQAKELFDAMPKDLQSEQSERFNKVSDAVTSWLENQNLNAEANISKQVTEAEGEILPHLALSQPPEMVSEALDKTNKLLNSWKLYTSPTIPQLQVSATTADRIKTIKYAANSAQEALTEYNRLTKQLQDAKTYDEYSSAILSLKSAMLVGSPLVESAALASVTRHSPEDIAGELLLPDDPLAWAVAKKGIDGLQIKPAKMVQAEIRNISLMLKGDKAKDVYIASLEGRKSRQIYSYPSPIRETPGAVVYNGKEIKSWSGEVYDPLDGKLPVFFMSASYGNNEDDDKLHVSSVSNIGKSPFFEAFTNIRLDSFVTSDGSILRPVTSVIDDLLNTKPLDPTYTAYVLNNLAEMTKLRPDAWGLQFAPECKALLEQVNSQLSEDRINPGDWMVTKRRDAITSKVGDIIRAVPPISFAKEAKLRQQLTAAVAKSGLTFVGHVGIDGNPVLNNPYDPPSAMWGVSGKASDAKAALLFSRKPQSDPAEYVSVNKGQPLVPLFALTGNPEKICDEALKSAAIQKQDAKNYLPPMFQGFYSSTP